MQALLTLSMLTYMGFAKQLYVIYILFMSVFAILFHVLLFPIFISPQSSNSNTFSLLSCICPLWNSLKFQNFTKKYFHVEIGIFIFFILVFFIRIKPQWLSHSLCASLSYLVNLLEWLCLSVLTSSFYRMSA